MRKSPVSRANRPGVAVALTAKTLARAVIALLAVFGLLMLGGSDYAFSAEPDNEPVAAAPAGGLVYVPGQVLVKFKESVGPAKRSQLEAGAGVNKALAKLGPEGRKDVRLLQLKAGTTVEQAVKKLRSSSDVVSAEPNYIRHATVIPTPNDPFFANQWGLFNNGQTIKGITGLVDADIDAEVAWFSSERGDSNPVTVAVIDSGIDQNHPDLLNSLWRNPGEIAGNGVDDDANGYVDDVNGYNMAGISQTYINAVWNIGSTGANTNWRGQSIWGTGRPLTQVGLFVGRVGTPTANIEIAVRDALTGSDLATATIVAGDVGTTAGVVNVTLSAPVTLSAKTYYILFRASAVGDASNHYQVYGNSKSQADYKSDPYRGGIQHYSDGTTWTVNTDDDWYFITNANAIPQDDNGHGTHVSGIIGAKIDNGVGIAGVSYGARIMAIKAGSSNGSLRSSDIIEALNYAADNGAKVINMSFGGNTTSSLEQAAVNYAYGKGAALFAAAGNHLPTEDATTFNFPASYAHVVSVGATTNLDTRAGFSNVNATVDVSAPGENIYSTMPTYAVALNSAGAAQDYDYLSGTSMATPMVAGLAALVLSRNPEYTAEQVMQVIETKLVDDKGPSGWDSSFGTGRITGVNLANEVLVGNNRIDGGYWAPALPPSSATTFGESLDSAGDRNDIFSVSVATGQRIKVSMTAPAGTDFDLYLYPPGTTDAALSPGGSGSAVVSSTGGTYPKEISYMPPAGAGGTYYLRVNAASGRGSYVITYSVMDADNDIPGVPAPPSPINGALQFLFDENDVFSVSLAAGEQIMTSLTGQLNTDFDLYLYPPGSTDLSSSPVATSAGSAYPEKIKYVVPAGSGGTYYLRVAFTSGSFDGTYALTYTIGPADVTPPITTASLSPALPDGDNGWYITVPTITLASNEAGVTYLQWETTWSGWWQTYTNPFGAYEGDNPLYYYSVDLSENQETTQSRSIKLDMSAPSAPTLLSASGDNSTEVTLSWAAASDGVSGISGYRIYDGDSAALLGSTGALSYRLTGLTPGVQMRYYVTAVDNAGHESGAGTTTTIATVSAGANVPVTVNSVTVLFSTVLSGGGVTVTSSTSPPAAQTGFQLNGVYYDVSSTVGFSGPVTVTLPYDPGSVVDVQALRLYHYSKTLSSWIDVTTEVDTVNHTVSGQVTSFSEFAAGLPQRVFRGFLPPLSTHGISVLKLGQIVPVKFQLRDASGNPVADAKARIYLAKVVDGVPGAEQPGISSVSGLGNTFRYSASQDQYVFNLATRRLSSGVWQIRVMLDDGVSYVALVRLSGR